MKMVSENHTVLLGAAGPFIGAGMTMTGFKGRLCGMFSQGGKMKSSWFVRLLLCGCMVCALTLVAQSAAPSAGGLPTAFRQAEFPFALSIADYPFSKWEGGFLISKKLEGSPSQPAVTVFDSGGHQVIDAIVWVEGASVVDIGDAVLAHDGSLIVSGGARKGDGTVAFFLARIGQDGKINQLLQTSPFVAQGLRPMPDGTVWALGDEREENGRTKKQFLALRQYSFEKGVINSVLDSNTINPRMPGSFAMRFPGSLRFDGKTNALQFFSMGTTERISVDLKTLDITRVKFSAPPDNYQVTGITVTDSGRVFASMDTVGRGPEMTGLAELVNQLSGPAQWKMVAGTVKAYGETSTSIWRLLGSSGNDLIYEPQPPPSTKIFWSQVPSAPPNEISSLGAPF